MKALVTIDRNANEYESMNEIRDRFGSQTVQGKQYAALTA